MHCLKFNYLILIAGSSPSSSSSSSVNPMASLGALQTLAGATAGLSVSSLAGKLCVLWCTGGIAYGHSSSWASSVGLFSCSLLLVILQSI